LGQEANIGALTAKTLRGAAGDYETNKQKYLGLQMQEEQNLKKNILDIVSLGDESSFKIKQAIAAIGPEKLSKSISLAAQILAQDRAEQEMGIKFSEEARAEALFPLQQEKLKAEITNIGKDKKTESEKQSSILQNLKSDLESGWTWEDLNRKYNTQGVSADEMFKLYNTYNYTNLDKKDVGYGPLKQSPELLASQGVKTDVEPKDGDLREIYGIRQKYNAGAKRWIDQ